MGIKTYFNNAVKKWKLYDNKVCHEISELIKTSRFDNCNFYEFAKGFVFASIGYEQQLAKQAEQLKDAMYRIDFLAALVKDTHPAEYQSANNFITKYKIKE